MVQLQRDCYVCSGKSQKTFYLKNKYANNMGVIIKIIKHILLQKSLVQNRDVTAKKYLFHTIYLQNIF